MLTAVAAVASLGGMPAARAEEDSTEQVVQGEVMPATPAATSYFVKTGREPGPTVCVLGGMHGDEPAGYLAAERLLRWTILRGRLVVLPRAHRLAIERGERAYPRNMNALFPGKADGDLMERLAYGIWTLIKQSKPDFLLTLHESVGYHAENPEHYGQTLTYDFHELDALMQSALDRVNPVIPHDRDKFLLLVKPFKTCPTYCAYRWLRVPATSIETCRKLPLEQRITYQLQMLMAFFDELGLGYEPRGLERLPQPAG